MKHRQLQIAIATLLGATTLCVGSTALAQANEPRYRTGEPITLNGAAERHAAAVAAQAQVIANFKTAYVDAGRPKIALFWHRQLDDSISATREASAEVSSQGALPRHNYDVKIKVESKTGSPKAYSLAPPPRAAEFESGFQAAMRAAGVRFVDRDTIVRLSALRSAESGKSTKDLDTQTVEMSALSEFAEYFAEVNFIADANAQGGLQVRVTVISTRSGVVVADAVPTQLYEEGHERVSDRPAYTWRAGDNGFERVERHTNGADEGREVAYALMEQMGAQLTAAR